MATGYAIAPEAWELLPGTDFARALRSDAEYVPHFEREKPRKSKKATRSSADCNFSAADASARDRLAGGVKLNDDDRSNLGGAPSERRRARNERRRRAARAAAGPPKRRNVVNRGGKYS